MLTNETKDKRPSPTMITKEKLLPLINIAVQPEFKLAMQRYISFHNQFMMQQGVNDKNTKFVVLAPSGQLCNRIRAVIATFTLAFLTDRVFIVESFGYGETNFYDLFEDPGFDITNRAGVQLPEAGHLIQLDGNIESAELFTCTDWSKRDENVLRFSGANYINTYLFRNPFFQKKLNALFLDDDLYRPFLFWLFRPIPEVIQTKKNFLKNLSSSYMLGFHIRTEFPISDEEWQAYRECAQSVEPQHMKNKVVWFVATDSEKGRHWAQTKLSQDIHIFSPERFVVGSYKDGLKQALIDVLIASESDQLFLSPFSSYSRIIALYARTPYTYVVTDYVMPEQDPHRTLTQIGKHCYRFLSKEDCAWHGHIHSVAQDLTQISCYTPSMVPDYC